MRIADLMIDAKVIAESDASPIQFDDTNNVFVYQRRSGPSAQGHSSQAAAAAAAAAAATVADEAGWGVKGAESADDPVEAAMRAAMNHGGASQTGTETDVDSVEQSLRSVQVRDAGAATGSEGSRSAEQLLIPSQVRSKSFRSKEDLTRQLFASYPLNVQNQQAAGPSHMTRSSSSSSASAHGAVNAHDTLLQMLSHQPAAGDLVGTAMGSHHANLLLSNGAPISSIWAPNASDMGSAASKLAYAGRLDSDASELYPRQQQQQQQQQGTAYQDPWSNHAYLQHASVPQQASFPESYGHTTPDPFNPHGYSGVSHLHPQPPHPPQQVHQHRSFPASSLLPSQQSVTPQPRHVHDEMNRFAAGGVQDPYYAGPGPAGAGALHPTRFP